MSSVPISQLGDPQIQRLVSALESLIDGDLAVDLLVACGERAVPALEELLLRGAASTIALPRCRAARGLGELHAYSTLLAYFEARELPSDPAVLFAEDAVRSAVARELLRWRSDEVYHALLRAAARRATLGLIEALGEFRSAESIPLLFETLEDDLCRNPAVDALVKTPQETRHYAVLSLRGKTEASLIGPAALRRRRATAGLLQTIGISREEWLEIGELLLGDADASIVLSAAAAGFGVANEKEYPQIIWALFRVADKLNYVEEEQVIHLLEEHKILADDAAIQVANHLSATEKHLNCLSPTWRILWRLGQMNAKKKSADDDV